MREAMQRSEEEKECTFQPERRERADDPSVDDFLKKEQEHLKHKEQFCLDKQKERDDAEKGTMQLKPMINDESRVLVKKMPPTQERLLSKKAHLGTPSPAREKAEERAGMKGAPPVSTLCVTIVDFYARNQREDSRT